MSFLDRLESRVIALVRTGRHGRTAIDWQEPFTCALHLQKDRTGRCCGLALEGHDFAEFDPRHAHEGPALLQTEDYVLEILEAPLGVSHQDTSPTKGNT